MRKSKRSCVSGTFSGAAISTLTRCLHFTLQIPANIRNFLIPLLQAWIDRRDHPLFTLETVRFGLVTFRRDPWPIIRRVTLVLPAGEVDLAALQAFSATF